MDEGTTARRPTATGWLTRVGSVGRTTGAGARPVTRGRPDPVVTGDGHEHHGYWVVPVPPEHRWLVGGAAKVGEHRLTMARSLDRPLTDDEVVHHLNGVRTDNRLRNLELWSTAHPSGQRVEEKVEFAVTMLRRYAPNLLA